MSESQLKNFWDNCDFEFKESLAVGEEDDVRPIGADEVELTPAAIVEIYPGGIGSNGAVRMTNVRLGRLLHPTGR